MSAGLPGFGLSGLFFLACALLALPREALRFARGTSTRASRRQAVRQTALALLIIAVVDLTFRFVFVGEPDGVPPAPAGGLEEGVGPDGGVDLFVLPIAPLALTAALLVGVLLFTKALELVLTAVGRISGRRPGRPAGSEASA
jgi:hypothetical protein